VLTNEIPILKPVKDSQLKSLRALVYKRDMLMDDIKLQLLRIETIVALLLVDALGFLNENALSKGAKDQKINCQQDEINYL
jgi:hypothetical protein